MHKMLHEEELEIAKKLNQKKNKRQQQGLWTLQIT